jgi:hypothetical protein
MMKKKRKKILLVGLGAEIGSMLLSMNNPNKDGLSIDTVITRPILSSKNHTQLESLYARLILSDPSILPFLSINEKNQTLNIRGRKIKIFWGDIIQFNLKRIKRSFDATIIATSKKHINNKNIMKKFLQISKFVFGVAESKYFPAIYPSLLNFNDKFINNKIQNIENKNIFVFGSCQTNGWTSQLRAVLETINTNCLEFKMCNMELDIVHPDTPTGRLGTKSIEPRDQDPRNNFRPSFSQANSSMKRLFPNTESINTVSLRTLISPPGFQISRFFFTYKIKNKTRLKSENFINSFKKIEKKYSHILRITDLPLGSRAFEMTETAAVILSNKKYFTFKDKILNTSNNENLSEIILQAYVHNTRGYCRSIIVGLNQFLSSKNKKAFF